MTHPAAKPLNPCLRRFWDDLSPPSALGWVLTYMPHIRTKVCVGCQREFETSWSVQKYCSKRCRSAHTNELSGMVSSRYPGMSTGTVGAISELRVAVDLLTRGYEVFRAVSQSCSCDLIAQKNGVLIRIESRTGYLLKSGKVTYSKQHFHSDHFAVILPEVIIYEPSLP
jgi:hypothetical protein